MTGILALILVAAAPSPAVGQVVQVVEHYAIDVPAGFALKDVSPRDMDFDLYALVDKRTGAVKGTVYIGNAPSSGSSMRRTSNKPYGQTSTQSCFPSQRARSTMGRHRPGSAWQLSPGRSGCLAARRAFSVSIRGSLIHAKLRPRSHPPGDENSSASDGPALRPPTGD